MIKNVAIYCRVSTEEQRKFGISVNDQKDSLTRYCIQNNYKIYDYYIDEGISAGTIIKRKEFVRLLKDLDNIDLIIFTKLDRFSRSVKDANDLLVTLDKHNTSFKAIDEDDIDVSTADGRFIFNLKVNLAEHERKKDSERIRRVNKYKYDVAKTVCTGRMSYGYEVSEDKHMIINKEQADHIKELFNYYLETNNLNKTTKWFSTKYGKRCSKTIKRYLQNSNYIGIYKKSSGEIVEDYCEAIIEKDVYYKVQKLLDKNVKDYKPDSTRKRHNTKPYIFSGLLRCPECGCNLSGKVNTGGSHYYNCKKHERGNCNNKKCINERDIEDFLLNNIRTILENRIIEIENINSYDSKKLINTNVIKNKINKLTNLYMNDLVDIDYYKSEYTDLQNQLKKARELNKPVRIDKKDIERISSLLKSDFLSLYNTLDNLEKRRLWSSIIDYIIVIDKKHMNITVY